MGVGPAEPAGLKTEGCHLKEVDGFCLFASCSLVRNPCLSHAPEHIGPPGNLSLEGAVQEEKAHLWLGKDRAGSTMQALRQLGVPVAS